MLPPIDTSLVPPDVRKGGPEAVKLYGAALQFESMLVSQISQQMFESAKGDGEDGSDGGPYASMLPTALSDALTAGGGLGLAPELYRTLSARANLGAGAGGEEQ